MDVDIRAAAGEQLDGAGHVSAGELVVVDDVDGCLLYTSDVYKRQGQNGVTGISDGAVSLDVGIQHTVQVRGISPELFQVAVCLIAGEGRRHHKRGMAEQIVLHVRLVNNLIFCAVEDAPDQLFIGDCKMCIRDR